VSLFADAKKLVDVLNQIKSDLQKYNEDERSSLTKKLAQQLEPLILELASVVNESKSKDEAKELMFEISEIVDHASSLATRGEMDVFPNGVMDTCWDLKTIFQETRYRNESL
jgi:uncharacterized phage infection (PIP) family protein YhgE